MRSLVNRTLFLLSVLLAALPLPAKEVRIHGYITELRSPTEFEIDDYHIHRDGALAVELEKDENDPATLIAFNPSELRVGSEVEIRGELDATGTVRATGLRVYLTDHRNVSRTALLDRKPALERAGSGWQGRIRVDGQTLVVNPSAKVTFLPNSMEKKVLKSNTAAARGEEDAGKPLESLESVGPDTWVTYKGIRQPDGAILATSVQFKHNELEAGEARLRKMLTPRILGFRSTGGEILVQGQKYRLYPDPQIQAYATELGNKLIPDYQRSMPAGSPDKVNFQFFVVDQKEFNAYSLANGTVLIHSRVFEVLENEAQFAEVLGHEISHAIQEHTYRQMQYHKKALLALRIGGAIAAARGYQGIDDLTKLIDGAVRNGYSRSLENQADRFGIEYMIHAGYDPREAPRVWKAVTRAVGDRPTNFFWDNHDNNTTRRSYLMAELKNNYADLDYSKFQKGEESFAAVAARVRSHATGGRRESVLQTAILRAVSPATGGLVAAAPEGPRKTTPPTTPAPAPPGVQPGRAFAHDLPYYSVLGTPGAWPAILSSIGLEPPPAGTGETRVTVAAPGAAAGGDWAARVKNGSILVLEGGSPLAESFGIKAGGTLAATVSLRDVHSPGLAIVWEKPLDLPVYTVPADAMVFTRDRWSGAPVSAGLRCGFGAVLWIAASPGERGYERFPYLLDALSDLGLDPPFRSARLWAFFDSSYRSRVDLDYFAARWRKAGISALHVAAWHFFEPDPEGDSYLKRLIEACHRQGIQVYAWLELPHVSEKFWAQHPEWREKTAVLQDAELDWRKLMNLTNRDCFHAAAAGVRELVGRFDWDGVNLAELYFESLHGADDPSRFTPMNLDVRAQFELKFGVDPLDLFGSRKDDAATRRRFLDFRAGLAAEMQEEWIGEIEKLRDPKAPGAKPDLGLVLTHVDDQFDPRMHEALGADASRVLPLLDKHPFTFLIEDPATVWNLGPQRYGTIAERYRAITSRSERLAVDVNIVNRYQNVYPTRQQTGVELFEILHEAAKSFARVALYFENSLALPDLKLLPSAASAVTRIAEHGGQVTVDSAAGIGLPWKTPGRVLVDGRPWPVADDDTVWLTPGLHSVESGPVSLEEPRVLRFNGELRDARVTGPGTVELTYESEARALALLDRAPMNVKVDGAPWPMSAPGSPIVFLPRGRHVTAIEWGGSKTLVTGAAVELPR